MQTKIIPIDHPDAISQAIQVLSDGELLAFPTDTVYGLGAVIHNPDSIEGLYLTKERDRAKAIPVLLGKHSDLDSVAIKTSPEARRLAERFWPGPLTLVVPRHPSLPEVLSPYKTIGVRMPNHPSTLELLQRTGPLAVTSANLSGFPSTVTAQEVFEQLQGRIPLIIDGGRTPGGSPSTVVDCTSPQLVILRAGPLTEEDLLTVLE
jgi:L-threonylcarbamoyladenylate synthase